LSALSAGVCLSAVFAGYHLGFARAWLDLAKEFEGRILTPFDMTMGIMSIYICAAIAYNLGKHYENQSARSLYVRHAVDHGLFAGGGAENERHLPVDSLGGTGSLRRFWWRSTALK
jgi:PTS system cellobiose-specific IIC component